jgi:GTP-binding protein Era
MTEEQGTTDTVTTRAGFVALAGATNVGKSTLLNHILQRSLAIATPKPQTTRTRLLGIHTMDEAQIIFVDTPGVHRGTRLIGERMNQQAREGIRDADVICWVVDAARGVTGLDHDEAAGLAERNNVIVALNKIDLVPKPKLLPVLQQIAKLLPKADCIPLSATKGENLDVLVTTLVGMLPESPFLYDVDALTDQPERVLVAEQIREQLFLQLREEMPYRIGVVVDSIDDRPKGGKHVCATIITDSQSSKAIILGAKGSRIKAVGTAARRRAEDFLGPNIFLELFVKVRADWQDNAGILAELGL